MPINDCSKTADGKILGTNIHQDAVAIRENQDAWGENSVCVDEKTGDHYVLNNAIKTNSVSPNDAEGWHIKLEKLNGDIDTRISEISGLTVEIAKNDKYLADLKAVGGHHDPIKGFLFEAFVATLGFGLITSHIEDRMNAASLKNPALRKNLFLQKKNEWLEKSGGCATDKEGLRKDVVRRQANIDIKGLGILGIISAALVFGGDALRKNSSPTDEFNLPQDLSNDPLPDLKSLDVDGLKRLYESKFEKYQKLGLIKGTTIQLKVELDKEIQQKSRLTKSSSPLDSLFEDPTARSLLVAGLAFGFGTTVVRDRYQKYLGYHDRVKAEMTALDTEAKKAAEAEIASGKCTESPIEASAEEVKASVSAAQTASARTADVSETVIDIYNQLEEGSGVNAATWNFNFFSANSVFSRGFTPEARMEGVQLPSAAVTEGLKMFSKIPEIKIPNLEFRAPGLRLAAEVRL